MGVRVYKVGDRFWSTSLAQWIASPEKGANVVELLRSTGPVDEQYLVDTLKFYGFPLGEYSEVDNKRSLEDRLVQLEAEMAEIRSQLSTFQEAPETSNTPTDGGLTYGV